jgi:phospho-N-acetylmuramoyl-pentapeptide-transferase
MGGLLVLPPLLWALIWGVEASALRWSAVWVVSGLMLVGAIDDILKLRRKRGLRAKHKMLGQLLVALPVSVWLAYASGESLGSMQFVPGLGWWHLSPALVVLVFSLGIVGTANGVNLTDGLDGLATGCSMVTLAGLGTAVWLVGTSPPTEAANGDFLLIVWASAGGLLAFLYWNRHPAQVFLGDTGSLALGGLVGWLGVATGQTCATILLGGVIVAETLSVMLQVASYRIFRRRIFRCAPLHHHFQLGGMTETKVVQRFWWGALVCCLVGLAALKLPAPQLRIIRRPEVPGSTGLMAGLETEAAGSVLPSRFAQLEVGSRCGPAQEPRVGNELLSNGIEREPAR